MKRQKTIRRLPPLTRKLAHKLNEAELLMKAISRMIEDIRLIEIECISWEKRQEHFKNSGQIDPLALS